MKSSLFLLLFTSLALFIVCALLYTSLPRLSDMSDSGEEKKDYRHFSHMNATVFFSSQPTRGFQLANLPELRTWWFKDHLDVNKPTPNDAVRRSTKYNFHVGLVSGTEMYESFNYMSLPRDAKPRPDYMGNDGKPFNDGAEYASDLGLTMTWTQFEYTEDVWVYVSVADDYAPTVPLLKVDLKPRDVVRSNSVVWEAVKDMQNTIRIKIPFVPNGGGMKISVEFQGGLVDVRDDDKNLVHRLPQHGCLIFASPRITTRDKIKNVNVLADVNSEDTCVVEPVDVSSSSINVTQFAEKNCHTLYFKPGVHYLPFNKVLTIEGEIHHVYIDSAAFVKAAIVFSGESNRCWTGITGYGVVSQELQWYEADPATGYHPTHEHNACWDRCIKSININNTKEICNMQSHDIIIYGVTLKEPAYHSMELYGHTEAFSSYISNYKQIGSWYDQTDGPQVASTDQKNRGVFENSFLHTNDDAIKAYYSNTKFDNIIVWKGQNGPAIQFGWYARILDSVRISNIHVVHNMMTWNIPNTCVIASMGALNADSCANSEESRIANLVIENVSSEGLNRCAFHLYALSQWPSDSIHINNLHIDEWNESTQEGRFSYVTKGCERATVESGAVRLQNMKIGEKYVSSANAKEVGRIVEGENVPKDSLVITTQNNRRK